MVDTTELDEHAARNSAILPAESSGGIEEFLGVPRLRYQELEVLGAGGMGEVFLAHDQDIDRPVAVKKLHHKNGSSVHRFVREIRSLGSLEHPGIVPIHDVGVDDDGRFFFVMKRLDGVTLQSIIDDLNKGIPAVSERMTLHERYRICQAILAVIGYAHSRGFLHRDLKPENIMLGEHGEVVILDWGLATARRLSDDSPAPASDPAPINEAASPFETQEGAIIGTPRYMSPEQASGEINEMDERGDLYSLATVFFEIFTLKHPLDVGDKEVLPLLMTVVNDAPTKAYMYEDPVFGRIPTELAYFLDRGLKKDPAQRYQSAQEMSEELEKVQSGNFCVVCPSTFVRRSLYAGLEQSSRSPLLFVPLLVTFVGFSLFTMVYFFLNVV